MDIASITLLYAEPKPILLCDAAESGGQGTSNRAWQQCPGQQQAEQTQTCTTAHTALQREEVQMWGVLGAAGAPQLDCCARMLLQW